MGFEVGRKRIVVLAVASVLAGLALLVAWWMAGERRSLGGVDSRSVATTSAPVAVPHELTAPEVATEPTEPDATANVRRTEVEEERSSISGVVVVPGGIPPGEDVYVSAEVAATKEHFEAHVA